MNNSNPLIPQGSLLEQEQNKKRHHFKVAILCVLAFNVLFVGGMLLIGCGHPRDTTPQDNTAPILTDTNPPAFDTNVPAPCRRWRRPEATPPWLRRRPRLPRPW